MGKIRQNYLLLKTAYLNDNMLTSDENIATVQDKFIIPIPIASHRKGTDSNRRRTDEPDE